MLMVESLKFKVLKAIRLLLFAPCTEFDSLLSTHHSLRVTAAIVEASC